MNAEKINLLAVLDDRVDSLKRMSPAIEAEIAKAVQAQATAAALLDEVEALREMVRKISDAGYVSSGMAYEMAVYLAARHEPKDAER
jgi:hypothetical protein